MLNGSFDLAVIGAGTAGYSAAIRASELGMKVALVERGELGGACLNRGCIPTKSLIYAAELIYRARSASRFGISFGEPRVDWVRTQAAKSETVKRLVAGLKGLLDGRGIEIIRGTARLAGPGLLGISSNGLETALNAEAIVVATGSAPKTLPNISIDGRHVLTSDHLLEIEHVPESIAIIGGGYIGCEFASLFNTFGSTVTIIETLPELLAQSDQEVRQRLAPAFEKRGVALRLGAEVTGVHAAPDGVRVDLADGPPVVAELALIATGRRPITDEIDLEKVGARTDDRGFVDVDETYSAASGVFAIGDCIATLGLAHAAFDEGYYIAERLAGGSPLHPDYDGIPQVTYSFPEVASVGLTEEEAARRGLEVEIARFPFKANSRAIIMKDDEGFVKIIALTGSGPIIGVHLIGGHVSELVAEAMLAVNWEASPSEVGVFHHPHPTLSEAIGEAALKLAGKPLHSL